MVTALAPFESALDEIVRERREVDAAEAQWMEKVAEYATSGSWAADGFLSASAALQTHCHMTRPAAAATVRLAVKLELCWHHHRQTHKHHARARPD